MSIFKAAEEYDKREAEHKEKFDQWLKECLARGMKMSVTYTPPEPTEEEWISIKARVAFSIRAQEKQQQKELQKEQHKKKELAIKTRANQKEFTKIFGAVILILIVIVIAAVVFK